MTKLDQQSFDKNIGSSVLGMVNLRYEKLEPLAIQQKYQFLTQILEFLYGLKALTLV